VTQNENSALIRESFGRKADDLEKRVDKKLDRLEQKLDDLEHSIRNYNNRNLNTRRYRLFHRIEPIGSFRYNPEVGRCQWSVLIRHSQNT
jgi:hypothetical protein